MRPAKLKVGLVQQAVADNDKATNWNKSAEQIAKLAAEGCECILLQELHSTLYFCQQEDTDAFDLAEPIPGPATEFFGELAEKHNIVLVTSLFEKRGSGLYHNTAVVFDRSKEIAGKYRKMHIPDDPGFYEKFYFTPGDMGFTPIETSVGKLGVLVCWDQWYPEAARLTALQGAEVLFYPTAIGWHPHEKEQYGTNQHGAWMNVMKGHAVANGIYVAAANRIGLEQYLPDTAGIEFWGASFICGPQGEILAQASHDKEEILIAEIDMNLMEDVRRNWPFFRDRRIENYGDITKRAID